MRLRIQFEKVGPARFASHKDVVRAFQRCFASAGIPVSFTAGFHPHMKLSFAPPLKTGWAGVEEYLDVELDGPPGELRDTCNGRLPEGLRVKRVVALAERAPKIASDVAAATLAVRVDAADVPVTVGGGEDGTERLLAGKIAGRFGGAPADDRPRVLDVTVAATPDELEIVYTTTMLSGKVVTPDEVLEASVGHADDFHVPVRVTRRAQFVARGERYLSPIDKGVLRNQS